jgi:plasmid maintenance system antidote protein VapI
MSVRTKKRCINTDSKRSTEKHRVTVEDHFKKVYGNTPEGAVYLAGLRYREDLTQKELGELIGVDQSNISKMENGERPIGKNIAKRLVEVFKVDYRLFL